MMGVFSLLSHHSSFSTLLILQVADGSQGLSLTVLSMAMVINVNNRKYVFGGEGDIMAQFPALFRRKQYKAGSSALQ